MSQRYAVRVQGRADTVAFPTYSQADAYRRAMLARGLFARLA